MRQPSNLPIAAAFLLTLAGISPVRAQPIEPPKPRSTTAAPENTDAAPAADPVAESPEEGPVQPEEASANEPPKSDEPATEQAVDDEGQPAGDTPEAEELPGRKTPAGERTPLGTDCYRFALSRPEVDLCLAGPNDTEQMKQALAALDAGPMDPEEQAWMRRIGDHIYANSRNASIMDGAK